MRARRATTHMKFKLCRSVMNVTGVRVRIYNEEKCIHERETVRSDRNDLRTLMRNLRDMQLEVNDFLTTLIQRRNVSSEMADQSISSDIESDSVEEEEVMVEEEEKEKEEEEKEKKKEEEEGETQTNPKKCKLSA